MPNWLPHMYDTLMKPLERLKFRALRKGIIQKATGEVLEIGSGTGFNFPLYKNADKVIAIEPKAVMRDQSISRAKESHVSIEVKDADAQELPFADNSFDTVVGTLVLCTIPDPDKALYEIKRVCKPNGNILFLEHVQMPHSIFAKLQNWITPLWKRMCDGCHLNRDSLSTIKKAGFTIVQVKEYNSGFIITIEAKNED
ncbi:class I SAM-dependent methyltransferase [Salipaludibacillus daqingensis]|uniref:class I SAM-dependent methyltransferase n=1 Tax=Salipaludibacillus daqingensis TaxID=3041001 RepID=UPI002477207C|nr:class I SAM-dependent methyltransferase [Salipaludibacillus daqingensis]